MSGLNGFGAKLSRLEERAPEPQPLFFEREDVTVEVREAFLAFYETIAEKVDDGHERPYHALSDDELEQLDQWARRLIRKE